MKRSSPILITLLLFLAISNPKAIDTNNVMLEVCTGTWCQWCPCGHQIADQVLQMFPNTLLIEYHGPAGGTDPFAEFHGNEILAQVFQTAGYPSGVVGRRSGIIDRGSWIAEVFSQSGNVSPGVRLTWTKTYNPSTRQLDVSVDCMALQNLTGNYFLNFMIMEDNIIYAQTGNSSCAGASNYVHKHLVRDMINGSLGTALNSGGNWAQNQVVTKTLSYTVNNSWVADNCEFACFVYKQTLPLALNGWIMQTKKQALTINTTGIQNISTIPKNFMLEQNYPNPFNPETNIFFSIPEDAAVTFKVYDVLGNEAAVILENVTIKAGTYNVSFDGSKLPSGIYFYRLTAGDPSLHSGQGFTETKKMMLIK